MAPSGGPRGVGAEPELRAAHKILCLLLLAEQAASRSETVTQEDGTPPPRRAAMTRQAD